MQRNIFLYLTTFLCGASIMGVEISSSRFMAPYFGSSMITWTVIIGVILVAMSLGNFIGGRMADHVDPAQRLYQLILWAAVWIALIPVFGKHLMAFIAAGAVVFFPDNLVLTGSITSCVLLFSLPCVILGATSPCMIKAATSSLENNGRIAGEIYGLSTLGSIFGTFLPTFATIPILGTDLTFFLFAAVLASLSAFNAIQKREKLPATVLLLIIGLASLRLSPAYAFWDSPLVETESVYNYLRVDRKDDLTTLSTHVVLGTQSMYSTKPGLTGLCFDLALLSHFFLGPHHDDKPSQALVLGFATGTFAKLSHQFFPGWQIDGVEIDPEIVNLGRRYFALTDDDARVFVEDGRVFVSRTDKKYRLIFLDAYHDVTCPFHMATREFFQQLGKNLDNDGIIALNINLRSGFTPDLFSYISSTMASVFPSVAVCSHPDYYNRIIFAAKNPDFLHVFKKNADALPLDHPLKKLVTGSIPHFSSVQKSEFILTDDLAPVEMIGFKMMNEQIRAAFKEILIRVILKVAVA
ncbi:MAG: spermidine synthase [Candidatus Rifleibacteriota bacterium]